MICKSATKEGEWSLSETTQKLHIRGWVGVQEVGGNVEGRGTKEPALLAERVAEQSFRGIR